MKLKHHIYIEIGIFMILYFILNLKSAIIISLFHFIPSIDYLMKKINFYPKLHRQLFHNIFVMIISVIIIFFITKSLQISILCCLNFVLHIIMDLGGRGVMIFFPISKYRLKLF
jgi:hypothetical protein